MSSGNVVIVSLLGDWGAALVKATWPTPADGVLGGPKLRLDSRTGLRPTESELGEVRVRTERVGSGWWGECWCGQSGCCWDSLYCPACQLCPLSAAHSVTHNTLSQKLVHRLSGPV